MTEMKGTPITRSGTHFIRAGFSAKGYSVDDATYGRFTLMKRLMLFVALFMAAVAGYVAYTLLFDILVPMAGSYAPLVTHHPSIWNFLIFWGAVFVGLIVYFPGVIMMGGNMVQGQTARDEGLSLLEQRSRAAFTKKRHWLFVILMLAAVWTAPHGLPNGIVVGATSLLLLLFLEGLYFKFVAKDDA